MGRVSHSPLSSPLAPGQFVHVERARAAPGDDQHRQQERLHREADDDRGEDEGRSRDG